MGEIKVNDYIVLDDRLYTDTDEWVKKEGDYVKVGITDYAQKQLKDIVGVDLPETGIIVKKGDVLATIDSIKTAADIYSPVTGTISEVNETLLEAPELINNDPYDEGWIAKIKYSDPSELEELLSPQQYAEKIREKE
jgi:glycine cleavage system H protein